MMFRILLALLLPAVVLAACGDDGTDAPAGRAGGDTPVATPTPARGESGVAGDAGDGLTTVEIVDRLAPSVVRVQTEGATLDAFGRAVPGGGVGTGVIVDAEDGYIVTNNHVVTIGGIDRPASRITVTLNDQRTFDATIIGRDPPTDLAVLQIDADDLTAATFGAEEALRVGEDVVAIGFALGLEGGPTVTRGVLSARNRSIDEPPYTINDAIQTDAGINPGNSGGPLVNARGEVVGINTAIIRGAQNIGFAISVGLVEPTVRELIENGAIERAFLGIGTVDVTPAIARNFDLPVDEGVAVTAVGNGTPAADAGLRPNDIIVEIDGEPVRNNGDLLAVLAEHRAGDIVEVVYYRDSERESVEVTLASRPN
ncbi:MAG TPA: trypsin-like peptidase domain-containing protein [Dehalococcoidia bacterium]|nr:trypsin-like peptidase domain-containing protein [Dehalococcoidia bacterium]